MTLVIAEISRFGVVMAADTAETKTIRGPSGREYLRVSFGTPKLFPVRTLNGGASFWGTGEIYTESPRRARVPTDVWLEDFIATNGHLLTLEQFAYTLRRTINILLGSETQPLGFQVAGLGGDGSGKGSPVFYRVSNVDSQNRQRPGFEVEQVVSFPNLDNDRVFADGDVAVFNELNRRVSEGPPVTTEPGHAIPRGDVRGRAEYRAAWVRFVSDLYQSAGLTRTIGGAITTLSIGPDGHYELTSS